MKKQRSRKNSTNYVVGLTYVGRDNSVFGRVTVGHGVRISKIKATNEETRREAEKKEDTTRTQRETKEFAVSARKRGAA